MWSYPRPRPSTNLYQLPWWDLAIPTNWLLALKVITFFFHFIKGDKSAQLQHMFIIGGRWSVMKCLVKWNQIPKNTLPFIYLYCIILEHISNFLFISFYLTCNVRMYVCKIVGWMESYNSILKQISSTDWAEILYTRLHCMNSHSATNMIDLPMIITF